MFMIIIHHMIVHGLGLSALSPEFGGSVVIKAPHMFSFMFVNSLCIIGVNCFILVSGWFSIKIKPEKLFKLIFECLFYTFLFVTLPYLFKNDYIHALTSMLIISHCKYWFFVDYIFLICFAPAMNLVFRYCSYRQLGIFILAALVIGLYFGWIWNHNINKNGYTFYQFLMMYCVGRYLRLSFDRGYFVKFKLSQFTIAYVLLALITAAVMYIFWSRNYYLMAWKMTFYNQPLIIVSSVMFILAFSRINLRSNLINKFAQSALSIYFVSSSNLFGGWANRTIASLYSESLLHCIGGILTIALGLIILAITINQLQMFLSNHVWSYIKTWKGLTVDSQSS